MIGFIEFLQPLSAVILIMGGLIMFIWTWLGWMITSNASCEVWKAFAINFIISVISMVAGFYIFHW